MPRAIIVAFDGVTTLDVAGPAEVFAGAARALGAGSYRVEIAAVGGGELASTSTLRLLASDLLALRPGPRDLVLVAGGEEAAVRAAIRDERLIGWVRNAARVAGRIGSVCSGAFVLAAAGVLDGRRAATHWRGCRELATLFPRVKVEPEAIFVVDGNVWTSAGVTTGIDMSLAIVEADHGRSVADRIAAGLVLYARRPGFQSQFSDALVAQSDHESPLARAVEWIRLNLADANVESLARASALSVRTLHRRCRDELGITPAKLIDRVRVEHARTLLATSAVSAKSCAIQSGFGNPTTMKRAFERELGVAPRDYRLLHARTG